MIGRRLSHYDVIEEISRGGMGVVYRAIDVNLDREVALKVLPDDLGHDAARRERLLQEARAASALEHPNIAVIHDVGQAEGITFIAMELIRGEKLSETLSRGQLSQARALSLAAEIAEGLARAHEKSIIHRDLKPANVIVTEDGHAKIIDFGLAKVVERVTADTATVSIARQRTEEGLVLGTAAYMSPEQARGDRVDHRSDVFALGVTLYEMVTGRPAYHGRSSLETMQAVLTQPVPPLSSGAGSSAEMTAELQRIIVKCTAKEPDDRFQGMKDLIVDLRAARRRLESSPTAAATPATGQHISAPAFGANRRKVAAVAIVAVAAVAATVVWFMARRQPAPSGASGKPAVAVLYFDNNTGDSSLDWMRTGLTDMMVTDLSQSTDIEVVGTDRLVQILQDMRRADDRIMSADVVREIANRAAVDTVLVGSYVKAGGTIRISARLQEARTGRIMSAERVEGAVESSLFSLVAELTRRFKSKMTELGGPRSRSILPRPGEPEETGLDRGVTAITTSSLEAYRYYAEGINYHERGLSSEAAPLLEKAIQIDPDFAMALAKLAVVYNNLGLFDKRDEFAKRALDHIDRLTTRERYYIEGFYYGLRPETRDRSVKAYEQGLALHPEHQASRHNLGLHYLFSERYPEAIQQYEELLRRGTSSPTAYENLSTAFIETGNTTRALEVAEQFVARYPENSSGLRTLGSASMAAGRLDAARAAYEKAQALDPLDFVTRLGRRAIALLQNRWTDAQAITDELSKSSSPFERFLGLNGAGHIAAARGRGRELLEAWDRAAALPGLSPLIRSASRNRLALMFLRQGHHAQALKVSELALVDARNRDTEFETLQLLAVAQAAVGRKPDSDKTLAELESRVKITQSSEEQRRVHWARGEIAMLRGDTNTAVAELMKAQQMLPVHGPPLGPPPSHGDLWIAAAAAAIKAGRDADAAPLLERLQGGHERLFAMEAYGRSFFLLGQIYERRGDVARAREQYARFLDLWKDGDLEREWVAEAQKKVAARS